MSLINLQGIAPKFTEVVSCITASFCLNAYCPKQFQRPCGRTLQYPCISIKNPFNSRGFDPYSSPLAPFMFFPGPTYSRTTTSPHKEIRNSACCSLTIPCLSVSLLEPLFFFFFKHLPFYTEESLEPLIIPFCALIAFSFFPSKFHKHPQLLCNYILLSHLLTLNQSYTLSTFIL